MSLVDAATTRTRVVETGLLWGLVLLVAALSLLPIGPLVFEGLAPGGCLAVQMPNNTDGPAHRAMREVAAAGPWAARLAGASQSKAVLGSFDDYRRWLQAAGCDVDLWQTTYVHALKGVDAIVEWFSSTGLKPFIDPLAPEERADYLARYRTLIAQSYPEQPDGMVLLRFPRLFIVATKRAGSL